MPQRKWWYCGYHLYDWFETSWQKWYTFKLDNSWLNFLWIMPLFGLREFGYSFACEQSLCVYFDYLCLYRDKTNTCCSGASYCQDKTTLDWRYYWLSPFSDLENLVKVLHAINLSRTWVFYRVTSCFRFKHLLLRVLYHSLWVGQNRENQLVHFV